MGWDLGSQIGHVSLPTPSPFLRSQASLLSPIHLSSALLLITTYCYCAHLRPPLTLSLPALKGITAIVATDRAGYYASAFAADTVTVLTSFAPGVDPKVKTVTGGRGRELRGRSNDVVVAPSHM